MNATWGSLQVAGDRGAPAIPLGGGLGDQAGNANALASHEPVTNTGHYKPITYGSSHIQAISFLAGRRGRREDDPDLRPVGRPDVAVVQRTRPGCSARSSG